MGSLHEEPRVWNERRKQVCGGVAVSVGAGGLVLVVFGLEWWVRWKAARG